MRISQRLAAAFLCGAVAVMLARWLFTEHAGGAAAGPRKQIQA
jgi:hypothetical protein